MQEQRACFYDSAVFLQKFINSGLADLPDDHIIYAWRMGALVIEAVAPPEKFAVLVA